MEHQIVSGVAEALGEGMVGYSEGRRNWHWDLGMI